MEPCPAPASLTVSPPLAPEAAAFVDGFAALPSGVPARTWPGQPAVASPWRPCRAGCCLALDGGAGPEVAAQWLRFLLAEFLAPAHALRGRVAVRGRGGAVAVLLADADGVWEGHVA